MIIRKTKIILMKKIFSYLFRTTPKLDGIYYTWEHKNSDESIAVLMVHAILRGLLSVEGTP